MLPPWLDSEPCVFQDGCVLWACGVDYRLLGCYQEEKVMIRELPYRVRAVHCDYRAEDEAVYEALKRALSP